MAAYTQEVTSGPRDPLTQAQAVEIVAKLASVLSGRGYQGQTLSETAESVVAENYDEYSESLQSLRGDPLGGPTASSYKEWFDRVSANPTEHIQTNDVVVAGRSSVFWSWTFPEIGNGQYPVKGFALLHINRDLKIWRRNFEFNSLAWASDLGVCNPPDQR